MTWWRQDRSLRCLKSCCHPEFIYQVITNYKAKCCVLRTNSDIILNPTELLQTKTTHDIYAHIIRVDFPVCGLSVAIGRDLLLAYHYTIASTMKVQSNGVDILKYFWHLHAVRFEALVQRIQNGIY